MIYQLRWVCVMNRAMPCCELGIKLCTCLWRSHSTNVFIPLSTSHFSRLASSQRLFAAPSWKVIISSDKMGFQLLSNTPHHCVIAYSSARTGSLSLYSSWVLVNLIAVLFYTSSHIIQLSPHLYSPMLSVQLVHSGIFKNAYLCSSELAASLGTGINVTLLVWMFGIHINLYAVQSGLTSVSLSLSGRIQGYLGTRSVASVDALCVR